VRVGALDLALGGGEARQGGGGLGRVHGTLLSPPLPVKLSGRKKRKRTGQCRPI
jgi:hypothetical protein